MLSLKVRQISQVLLKSLQLFRSDTIASQLLLHWMNIHEWIRFVVIMSEVQKVLS